MISFEFKTPLIIFSIPFVLGIIYVLYRAQKPASVRFSSKSLLASTGSSLKMQLIHLPFILRLIVITLFLIALAGPRSVLEETLRNTEGVDIVLAIDSSGSMAGEDFTINGKRTNRLDVVKNVVKDFINERQNDRIGLVTFAGLAYTVTPLTTDYSWLSENLERMQLGMISKDGTAIGSGIMTALSRLKTSTAKSKIVILLTDGMNNEPTVNPLDAARVAKSLGIKIYTIGAGSKGYVPFPVKDFFGRTLYQNVQIDLDESALKEIATTTNGLYFRATDTQSLKDIYQEIDSLEKTKIEETGYKEYKELFVKFLLAALAVLALELLLSNTLLLRIP